MLGAGGKYDAFVVETAHQGSQAFADFAQDVFSQNFGIFKDQRAGVGAAHFEFFEFSPRLKPGKSR